MIDIELLESYTPERRDCIRKAIIDLTITGVLADQRQRLFARIVEGSEKEPVENLAKKILDYRLQSHGLLTLQQLGESMIEELNNESA